jgi:hypothetical protein
MSLNIPLQAERDFFLGNAPGIQPASPIEMLASGDRYKIIDTYVAVKCRCVPVAGHIA